MRMGIQGLVTTLLFYATGGAALTEEADYPQDYRSWTHTKSGITEATHPVFAQSAGLHHIYANPLALQGQASGHYQYGATFVVDFFALQTQDHLTNEQHRIRIDVMQYDPERFAATGGWGYASFAGTDASKRVHQDTASNCHACHTTQEANQFVFHSYRE